MKKGNARALLPLLVFLVLYLGLGLFLEYCVKIPMGFYCVPIVGAFLAAILAACLQNRKVKFDEKLALMARGIGSKDILTMLLIFLEAGVFVGVVGRSGAQSVVYFLFSFIPPRLAAAVLFVASCFVSLAMGTSVGTITLLTPIAVETAAASGHPAALLIATVIGGSMFGDNLSMISDTTIAACNGQGCAMKDKFRGNFRIALPAAILSLLVILLITRGQENGKMLAEYNLIMVVPYVLVLIGGIAGVNVFSVLLVGIVSGAVLAVYAGAIVPEEGHTVLSQLIANIGSGISGMFETCMVAVLVAALCELIREYGGFDALLYSICRIFRGKRMGQLGIGVMVAAIDAATANNTVAIVIANPIAKDLGREYEISPNRCACLLDTFSCIMQGVLPYGAQMLVAISHAEAMNVSVSAFDLIPNLFYPAFLLLCSLIAMFVPGKKKAG